MKELYGIGGLLVGYGLAQLVRQLREPDWAKSLMSHITIGGLTIPEQNERGELKFINLGHWTSDAQNTACDYIYWRHLGNGQKQAMGLIKLRASIPIDPDRILEIYHSWTVPTETLFQTDLSYRITIEERSVLQVRIPLT